MNPAWAERLFARCHRHEPDLVVAQDIAGADDHSLGRDVNGSAEMLKAQKDAQSRLRCLSPACARHFLH
jgi:hypothetical protein